MTRRRTERRGDEAARRDLEARADRAADALAPSLDAVPASPAGSDRLPSGIAARATAAFGHDFSRVRVHTDEVSARSADDAHALASTSGEDVTFARGQYGTATAQGRHLLAHELAHVAQQSLGNAPAVQKQEPTGSRGQPPVLGQIRLTFDLNGRVEVTVSGPENVPVVSSPTIGIRQDAQGHYHLLVGGKDKIVSVDEIPAMLRSFGGGGSGAAATGQPGSRQRTRLRVPSCQQLADMDYRFENFDATRRLFYAPGTSVAGDVWLPLTRALFDALCELCRPQRRPAARPQEAVPPVTPPGTAAT